MSDIDSKQSAAMEDLLHANHEQTADEWAQEFKKKYRHRYSKSNAGKAVIAQYMWIAGKHKHGLQDNSRLFTSSEMNAFTLTVSTDPAAYQVFVRHRLAGDWCNDHSMTATIQLNALKSCLSDYRNIVQQCLLGQVLHDIMDEYNDEAKLKQARLMISQLTLPDYLYGDSVGTFGTLRSNIRFGIRYLIAHNSVMSIVAKQLKMPDVEEYFSADMSSLQEQVNELNEMLSALYDVAKTKGRYTDTPELAQHLRNQLRPIVFKQEPIPRQALAEVKEAVSKLKCFIGNASMLIPFLNGLYCKGANDNDQDE